LRAVLVSRNFSVAVFFVCLPLLLLVAGCGSNVHMVPTPVAATVSISASPSSIASGGAAVLTVSAANATSVTVTGSDGSSYTMQAGGGTQSVSPSATTTYTATANGASGSVTASAMVTVTATPTPPPTVTITANPTSVTAGGSAVLTVTASNASTVTITGTDGSSYTLQTSGGAQTVSPAASTTYTATATGAGGSVTATAMLTIVPAPPSAPTITISANPTSILAGGSSVLTVAAANATSVTVTGTDGSSYTLQPAGGMQTVSPAATTTYTATARGSGGSATATVTVTVVPAPIGGPAVTISANPTSILAGGSSVLTVTATNATSVTVTGTDGSAYTLQPGGGMQSVSPTATTTYTATATGAGGMATATAMVAVTPRPTVSITANPASIAAGSSTALTVTAANATSVTVTGTDNSSYTLQPAGGTQNVSPTITTTYTATATGAAGTTTASVTVTVAANLNSIKHVIFMLQENHTFDNYFGMLNPYRISNQMNVGDDGVTYAVDGIDDKVGSISNSTDADPNTNQTTSYSPFKFTSTCVDDETSSWLESYGQVSRYDFSEARPINMDGFVHTAENYANDCINAPSNTCAGNFTDMTGQRAMGYYDEHFLNYYYYMASEFALSDRWFSPLSSKSIPNRIATFTGGTTQGLAFDPGGDDQLPQLDINTIFQELDQAGVKWKIYYTVTQGSCTDYDDCSTDAIADYPATDFSYLSYSQNYLYQNPTNAPCTGTTVASNTLGYSSSGFCIDPNHIAPISQYKTDVANNALPPFAFIEAGYGVNDEHPGSGQSILEGQQEVSSVVSALMNSPEWTSSVFFLAYDEGGGPYDHVPPVAGSSNKNTDATVGAEAKTSIPDISTISVNPDVYNPCVPADGTGTPPTLHCDLTSPDDPGTTSTDAAAQEGFRAQLGFRVPNMVISPFTRRHYVSHIPMDHTAVIKFVENRFIGPNANLTMRDTAQPNLLDFFDFTNEPYLTPPATPTPFSDNGESCTPETFSSVVVPTVSISANPMTVSTGGSSVLTVTATNATAVTITSPGGTTYTLPAGGGMVTVTPAATTTYTATATGSGASASEPVTVTVQ
jgi:phospholipase C